MSGRCRRRARAWSRRPAAPSPRAPIRAGAVVTREGCALGVVPATGAIAELRWAEVARGHADRRRRGAGRNARRAPGGARRAPPPQAGDRPRPRRRRRSPARLTRLARRPGRRCSPLARPAAGPPSWSRPRPALARGTRRPARAGSGGVAWPGTRARPAGRRLARPATSAGWCGSARPRCSPRTPRSWPPAPAPSSRRSPGTCAGSASTVTRSSGCRAASGCPRRRSPSCSATARTPACPS